MNTCHYSRTIDQELQLLVTMIYCRYLSCFMVTIDWFYNEIKHNFKYVFTIAYHVNHTACVNVTCKQRSPCEQWTPFSPLLSWTKKTSENAYFASLAILILSFSGPSQTSLSVLSGNYFVNPSRNTPLTHRVISQKYCLLQTIYNLLKTPDSNINQRSIELLRKNTTLSETT